MEKDLELRRLKRVDLLEMLLEQSKEVEQLKQENAQLKAALAKRDIDVREAGNLAEAAMKLNNIFEVAQKTADQYLDNIKRMEKAMQQGGEPQ